MSSEASLHDSVFGTQNGKRVVDVTNNMTHAAEKRSKAEGGVVVPRHALAAGRETDPRKLEQRQKQIDYGKNTRAYQRYLQEVPRRERDPQLSLTNHPRTPDIQRECSKRAFDGVVKVWRRQLHLWDDDQPMEEAPEAAVASSAGASSSSAPPAPPAAAASSGGGFDAFLGIGDEDEDEEAEMAESRRIVDGAAAAAGGGGAPGGLFESGLLEQDDDDGLADLGWSAPSQAARPPPRAFKVRPSQPAAPAPAPDTRSPFRPALDAHLTQPAESSLRARLDAAKAMAPEAEADGASIFGAFDDASLA